jgi:hypothetical protein
VRAFPDLPATAEAKPNKQSRKQKKSGIE